MKKLMVLLCFGMAVNATAQQSVFKKGIVMDSVPINGTVSKDSVTETFALYLPQKFEVTKSWPVIFLLDTKGRGRQAVRLFRKAAEEQGYIMAASNSLNDSLSTSNILLTVNRMFNKVISLFPVQQDRVYVAGIENGGRMASIFPVFINNIEGVVSFGGPLGNSEVFTAKKPFHYIGIVDKNDFNYPTMLVDEKTLNTLKFPNQLLPLGKDGVSYGEGEMQKAMEIFTLAAMAKGNVPLDSGYVEKTYQKRVSEINSLIGAGRLLEAETLLEGTQTIFRVHRNVEELKEQQKALRKEKMFKAQKRNENAVLYKESLIKQDYSYYLEEDVLTYNYNNLGWWNHQMQELAKYGGSADLAERQMGKRLSGFINALIEDHLDMLLAEKPQDVEALLFLYMLKTLTEPLEYSNYLQVISYSSLIEDHGTALFYLEELLKKGFKDKTALYSLEHTALLRITPEFNDLVAKYLKESRYGIPE